MDWMKETHQAGIDKAYDGLSNGDDLAGVYIQHALPVVQQQLRTQGFAWRRSSTKTFRSGPPRPCDPAVGSAFGTKRKWAGRQDRLTRSKMTPSRPRPD